MNNKGEYSQVVDVDEDLAGPTTPQLEFQDFNIPEAQSQQIPAYQSNFQPPPVNSSDPTASASSSFFSLEYYRLYFDIDTDELKSRLLTVFQPPSPNDRFIDLIAIKPDLYGPFWIPTSLACLLFATSSLMLKIGADMTSKPLDYDFSSIWTSLLVLYSYSFAVPSILYVASKYMGASPILLNFVSVYGYACAIFAPVAIIATINVEWLRWIAVLAGAGYSGYFILTNLYPTFKRCDQTAARSGLALLTIVLHLLFSILLKVQYLSYDYSLTSPGAATPAPTPVPTPSSSPTSA